MRTVSALSLVTMCALMSLAGCAKRKECEQTTTTINAAVARIEGMTFPEDDPAAMLKSVEELVKAAEDESEKLGKLEITTAELSKLVQDYKKMLDEVAEVSKDLLAAGKQSAELEKEAKKSEKDVQAALDAIGKECERGAAGCLELAQKMADGPSGNEGDEEFVAGLRKYATDLAAFEPPDPKVGEAVKKLVKAVNDQAALLEKALKAQADVDKAVKALDAAVAPEDRIVGALNEFCGAK